MATPTITQVSPAEGPSSGYNILEISGTNFAVPVVTNQIPMVAEVPTVSVTVGGYAAVAIRVLNTTTIHAILPPSRGAIPYTPTALDLIVTNLDEDGDPVGGESVTEASAYTYKPWKLGPSRRDPPLLKVIVELINRLRREVTDNVAVHTHVDYGDQGTGTLTALAEAPSLSLRLDMPRDVEWSQWDNGFEEVPDPNDSSQTLLYRGQRTHMIVANITAVGEGLREAMFLVDALCDSVCDNPYVTVTADTILYPGQEDQYLLELSGYPTQAANQGEGKLVVMNMQVRVRGIRHIGDYPVNVVWKMAEAYLLETNMDGDAYTEVQLVSS